MISAEPTITMISREEEGLLLLASDGLFEGVANETIANCYHRIIGQMNERIDAMKTFLDKIANLASQKSGDNITIIVVGL